MVASSVFEGTVVFICCNALSVRPQNGDADSWYGQGGALDATRAARKYIYDEC